MKRVVFIAVFVASLFDMATAQIDDTRLTEAVVDCQLRYGTDRDQFIQCLTNVEEGYRRYLGALERATQDPTIERLLRAPVEQCADIWKGDWTYIGYCAQMQLRGFGEVLEIQNSGEFPREIVGPAVDACARQWEGAWDRIGFCVRQATQQQDGN